MDEGVKAKLALEAGACTEAVEKIIEANTLLSGLGLNQQVSQVPTPFTTA